MARDYSNLYSEFANVHQLLEEFEIFRSSHRNYVNTKDVLKTITEQQINDSRNSSAENSEDSSDSDAKERK